MITTEMVKYWIKETDPKEIIQDYKDIANGKYSAVLLRKDIIETWHSKGE
tara:strand:- start:666 stop:815 length:150 start_codon:yes stop_codon:yes gene_type:complete